MSGGTRDDVKHLRGALRDIERRARDLPWAGTPGDGDTWTTRAYVRAEQGLPVVDLHDLDRRLAVDVVSLVLQQRGRIGPEVRLITGRGSHSKGGKGVLREAVIGALQDAGVAYDDSAPGHLDVQLTAAARTSWWRLLRRLLTSLLRLVLRSR